MFRLKKRLALALMTHKDAFFIFRLSEFAAKGRGDEPGAVDYQECECGPDSSRTFIVFGIG